MYEDVVEIYKVDGWPVLGKTVNPENEGKGVSCRHPDPIGCLITFFMNQQAPPDPEPSLTSVTGFDADSGEALDMIVFM